MITEIILIVRAEISFSLNVIPSNLIECKSVAKIFNISADGAIIRFNLFTGERCSHAAGGAISGGGERDGRGNRKGRKIRSFR